MDYSKLTALSLRMRYPQLARAFGIFMTGAAFGWILGMITMALAISHTGG